MSFNIDKELKNKDINTDISGSKTSNFLKKNKIILIVGVVLVIALAGFGFWMYKKKGAKQKLESSLDSTSKTNIPKLKSNVAELDAQLQKTIEENKKLNAHIVQLNKINEDLSKQNKIAAATEMQYENAEQ